ncbi:MAG: hypothetical protein K9N47_26000 [Prosthecobacter sp.]|uniref:hypothetical protein n=1 Tax=Prosthecobacter sp. TaxID=1965333 RepID=UPI002624A6F6|nr:hypothetical protein [Prosthecobacter sp.]MCF7789603.1 hypothetical protein [Prosthecobacter sp.]
MKAFLSALSLLFCTTLACAQAPAQPDASSVNPATDGHVWGALIFATNDAAQLTGAKEPTHTGLPKLNERLGRVFPYKHFEILGQHRQDIFREYESWVVPSRELFMKIDSKGPADKGGVNLHLQVWREQQVLVKSDAVLRKDSPLFIGGPPWKEGRLIFVLFLEGK